MFFFDPDDPTVVQNSKLTNEREYYYKAEVVAEANTALTGDASVVCDRRTPKVLFFAIQADDVQPGESIANDFIKKYKPLAESQIAKAGYRLAAVLNDVFGK